MAHELGHNFGARHDGVARYLCSNTPQTFLMAPFTSITARRFSSCSLNSYGGLDCRRPRHSASARCNTWTWGLGSPPSPFSRADEWPVFSAADGPLAWHSRPLTNVQLQVEGSLQISTWLNATLAGANCSVCEWRDLVLRSPMSPSARNACSIWSSPEWDSRAASLSCAAHDGQRSVRRTTIPGQVQVGVLRTNVDLGVTIAASVDERLRDRSRRFRGRRDVIWDALRGAGRHGVGISIGGIPDRVVRLPARTRVRSIRIVELDSRLSARRRRSPARRRASRCVAARTGPQHERGRAGEPAKRHQPEQQRCQRYRAFAVGAEREVRTTVSAEELRAVVGATYELTYTLDASGRLPPRMYASHCKLPTSGVNRIRNEPVRHLRRRIRTSPTAISAR